MHKFVPILLPCHLDVEQRWATPEKRNRDVPNGTRSCAFAFNADYWVTFGTTAVSQTFSSYSSAGSTLAMAFNPDMRYIGAATTALSIYSNWTCKGSVSFYK